MLWFIGYLVILFGTIWVNYWVIVTESYIFNKQQFAIANVYNNIGFPDKRHTHFYRIFKEHVNIIFYAQITLLGFLINTAILTFLMINNHLIFWLFLYGLGTIIFPVIVSTLYYHILLKMQYKK